ncbi:hypothetical protein AVEN_21854-1 [Araneus ventricosus]|uniref:Uncharacterized protein n=1 Tax=Araneus ventricosus TaxID=182803 RepID=A0A4Y2RB79_ARAVE|nr:hypothetical protein AVEN_21854-1 [Araneus ventricosus]
MLPRRLRSRPRPRLALWEIWSCFRARCMHRNNCNARRPQLANCWLAQKEPQRARKMQAFSSFRFAAISTLFLSHERRACGCSSR